jgi:chitodextrinase
MTATTASDASGVEYYFACVAGGGNDSGWQDGSTYEDTGLSPDTQYTYTVKARDKSINQNETDWSSSASATTEPEDATPPSPDPMMWSTASPPAPTEPTSILMTATTASDTSGVEYYFECTAGGGNDSGWQDSPAYEDTGLSPDTQYTYRVKARDKSVNQNETSWSSSASATTDALPEWTELTYDDFESGWGSYTDGGKDCRRYTGGTYAHQGSCAADIQDNSGTSSSFYYTNGVDADTPGYSQIKIEFWFYPRSMVSGEDFWLQYYDGSTWRTVASYAHGTDFSNGVFYNKTVYINEADYTFPTNMKIRFTCDASANRDDVYIDEIRVSAK